MNMLIISYSKLIYLFLLVCLFLLSNLVTTLLEAYILFVILFFIQFLVGCYRNLSMPSNLFMYFFTLFLGVSLLIENYIRGFDIEVFNLVYASTISVTLAFVLFSNSLIRVDESKIFKHNSVLMLVGCIILTFLGILTGLLFFIKIGTVPLLSNPTPEARIAYMSGNGSLLQPLRVAPIVAMVGYFGTRYKLLFIILFLISNILFLGTGFRGAFAQNILHFWIVNNLINRKEITITRALIFGIGLLLLVSLLGIMRGDGSQINSFLLKLISGITVSVFILGLVVEHFTNFQYGATFFYNYSMLLPGESVEYTSWLTTQLPINFNGGVTPTLVGDAYINFGVFTPLFFFVLGSFLRLLDYASWRINRIPYLVLITLIAFAIARASTGGLSNTLFHATFIGAIIFLLGVLSRIKIVQSGITKK